MNDNVERELWRQARKHISGMQDAYVDYDRMRANFTKSELAQLMRTEPLS